MSQTSGSYGPPIDVGMATLESGDIYFYNLLIGDGEVAYVIVTAYSGTGSESDLSNEKFLPACLANTDCSDGDVCTGEELCVSGICGAGPALDCSISSPCQTGTCDSQLGCLTQPLAEGTICDDGDVDTIGDVCQAGVCVGALPPPPPECVADADCSDGDVCTGDELCLSGNCTAGTALDCSISSPCQTGTCDSQLGCLTQPLADGTYCDDGDAETGDDMCRAGLCVGELPPPPPECVTGADCGDGDLCNGVEGCVEETCVAGAVLDCAVESACVAGLCDSQLGCLVEPMPDGALCDDGNLETSDDACRVGLCVGELPPPPPECLEDADCRDANSCTAGVCGADLTCTYDPLQDGTACYDSDPDTIGELCLAGACEASCRIGVDCESGAGRDYVLGWTSPSGSTPFGYLLYLRFDLTDYGEPLDLGFVPLDATGALFFALSRLDSNRTYYALVSAYDETGAEWQFGDEVEIPALLCDPTLCDDGNSCTADACTPGSCENQVVPDEAVCDDGDPYTGLDTCVAGVCQGIPGACPPGSECALAGTSMLIPEPSLRALLILAAVCLALVQRRRGTTRG